MDRLLFLDIDGVLNQHECDPEVLCGQIHHDKVAMLNRILRTTNAGIVLSSAWRYLVHRGEMNLQGLDWLLRSHGILAGRLLGITRPDSIDRLVYHGIPGSWPQVDERGAQVTDWLTNHQRGRPYVVLDDLDLGISDAGHPLVLTNGSIGLTAEDTDKAIAWLLRRE